MCRKCEKHLTQNHYVGHRQARSLKQEKTVIQARRALDFPFSRNQHDLALTQARKTYSQGHNCIGK